MENIPNSITKPANITMETWQTRHDYGEKYIHDHSWMFLIQTFKKLGKFEEKGLVNKPQDWLVDLGEMWIVNMYEIAKRVIKMSNSGIDNETLRKGIAEFVLLPIKGMLGAMKGMGIDYMPMINMVDGQLDMHKDQVVREYRNRFSQIIVE